MVVRENNNAFTYLGPSSYFSNALMNYGYLNFKQCRVLAETYRKGRSSIYTNSHAVFRFGAICIVRVRKIVEIEQSKLTTHRIFKKYKLQYTYIDNRKISKRLKSKIYKTGIRPIVTYPKKKSD